MGVSVARDSCPRLGSFGIVRLRCPALYGGMRLSERLEVAVLIYPALLLHAIGIREPLTEGAHGPPFLTGLGLFGVFGTPITVLATYRPWKSYHRSQSG
jgi:hypothetical protein